LKVIAAHLFYERRYAMFAGAVKQVQNRRYVLFLERTIWNGCNPSSAFLLKSSIEGRRAMANRYAKQGKQKV